MKKIFVTIFISIIFLGPSNLINKVNAKEITNLQWKKSVAKGKKLTKFRETVTSPALGEKAWKKHYYPEIVVGIKRVIILIVQIMEEMLWLDMEEEIEPEVSIQQNQDIQERNGFQ